MREKLTSQHFLTIEKHRMHDQWEHSGKFFISLM